MCTCQDVSLFVLRGHRVSCSILQRDNIEDASVTQRLTALLNTQLSENTFEFEFDKINHVSSVPHEKNVFNSIVMRWRMDVTTTTPTCSHLILTTSSAWREAGQQHQQHRARQQYQHQLRHQQPWKHQVALRSSFDLIDIPLKYNFHIRVVSIIHTHTQYYTHALHINHFLLPFSYRSES